MLILLSPSKTQDFSKDQNLSKSSILLFKSETSILAEIMKEFSIENLSKIMKISQKISKLNYDRFQNWNDNFSKLEVKENLQNFKIAINTFKGDVYKGFDLENWTMEDYNFAESYLKIISGFYGILTPLTNIKPYRLEMGVRFDFAFENTFYKNLYQFWNDKLTKKIQEDLEKSNSKFIINLASNEYSKAINLNFFKDKVYNIFFKVEKNGIYKTIAIFAKRERGKMANFIIKNKITNISDLLSYKNNGFYFSENLSQNRDLVFIKN
jgi:cytoplasmic iron level regulating protein YaaA (DUF328/UPF0246 family)